LGTLEGVEAEVEYTALVSVKVTVKVNLGIGEVASVDIRAAGDGDEVPRRGDHLPRRLLLDNR
jgi:hypothetical protein